MTIAVRRTATPPLDDATVAGLRDMFPNAVGVVPLAVLIGVAIHESISGSLVGWLGGPMIAGGSAHLAVLGAIGGSAVVTVLLGLLVNARGLIYSAAVAPVLADQPRWFRWAAPYVLVDQMFALVMSVADRDPGWVRRYYVTAGAFLYSVYVAGITVGMLVGPVIAADSPITLAIPMVFASLLVRGLTDRTAWVTAAAAGSVAAFAGHLPAGVGFLVAIVAGTVAGCLSEERADA